jgi:hypothetical protein
MPITLDLKLLNYTKWSAFFTAMCGKFGLLGHINGSIPPRPVDRTWSQPDACVRSWMYGCIDDSVLDLAMEPEQTARALFVAITNLFHANQETRAIVLGQEFHSMTQCDLSIDEYAQRMKHTADALRDVGHAVSETQLVLNLLRGLNPHTADIIANATVLPSFVSAHNTLWLKELRLADDTKVSSDTALTVVAPSSTSATTACTSPSCRSSPSGNIPNRDGGEGSGKGKGKGGRGGNNGGGHRSQPQQQQSAAFPGGRPSVQPTGPWVYMNPWVVWAPQQQQWRPPPAPLPQAHTSFAPPSTSGGWDQGALIASLNQMALQGGASPWVLDTGATSHVLPRWFTSFPSISFAVLHHSWQWGFYSYF